VNAGWQAGSHSGATDNTILTDSTASWTTDEWVGYWIKNVTDGSVGEIVSNTATTITVDDLYGGTSNDWVAADVYNIQVPINPDAGQGISHRFMIKTREDGVDIDRRRLLGQNRRYGKTYGEFSINGTSRGNNVLALSDSDDLNNTTPWVTIDALTDITNTEGLRLIDINGNGTNEEYYSEWTRGAQSINTFFEYLKHTSADTTTETLQGENGELHRGITHYFAYDAETGAPTTATNDKHVFGTLIDHGARGYGHTGLEGPGAGGGYGQHLAGGRCRVRYGRRDRGVYRSDLGGTGNHGCGTDCTDDGRRVQGAGV
jgi:hypothetical protein